MTRLTMTLVSALLLASASKASAAAGPAADVSAGRAAESALMQGRNYADARSGTAVDVDDVRARAARHASAMNAGKNYADAYATVVGTDAGAAMDAARRHELAMNRGLDHEDARAAASAR